MCSAIQPSSRAMFDAMRSAKHFLPEQRIAAVARSVGPDLARLGKVHDVLVRVAGPGHVLLRPASSGAPTLCMHGTTRLTSLSISAKTGSPMRAMIRMLTTTYGESVSCTPICDMGEPTAPMLNGSTYIVRPRHAAAEQLLQRPAHLERVHPVVGRARRLSFDSEQMKVRSSTRATSLGVGARVVSSRAKDSALSLVKRAAVDHLAAQSVSYSSCEPSTQWIAPRAW